MSDKIISTFDGGMDMDTSITKRNKNTYYSATDFRIITDNGLQNGAMSVLKGTKAKIEFLSRNIQLRAYTSIDDELILFATKDANIVPYVYLEMVGQLENGEIFSITLDDVEYKFAISNTNVPGDTPPAWATGYIRDSSIEANLVSDLNYYAQLTDFLTITYDPDIAQGVISIVAKSAPEVEAGINRLRYTYETPGLSLYETVEYASSVESFIATATVDDTLNIVTPTVICSDHFFDEKFNFTDNISCVSRKESEYIKKVYWTDYGKSIRSINISSDNTTKPPSSFDIAPPFVPSIVSSTIIGGGSYTAGLVSYSYQMYNKNGAETTFAPESGMIALFEKPDNIQGGSELSENTNKAVSISITGLDSVLYNRIRIVALHYKELNATPTIGIVSESEITGNTFSTVDTGQYIGTVLLEEFRTLKNTDFSAKVLESQFNILFAGGILEKTFSSNAIDNWDSRVYRFNSGSPRLARIYSIDGTYIDVNTSFLNNSNSAEVSAMHDCVNRYNQTYTYDKATRDSTYGYKYNVSGELGGSGKNIEYYFTTNTDTLFFDDSTSKKTLSYECMPGETYRIGIQFFNKKGQPSFVKWVGDVLFDELIDHDNQFEYDFIGPTGQSTTVSTKRRLVIKVNNFPDDNNIAGWQVVRCKIESQDRSVAASGILNALWKEGDKYGGYFNSDSHIQYPLTTSYVSGIPIRSYITNMTPKDFTVATTDINKHTYELISPEGMFDSEIISKLGDCKIKIVGKYSDVFSIDTSFNSPDPSATTNSVKASSDMQSLLEVGNVLTLSEEIVVNKYRTRSSFVRENVDDYYLNINNTASSYKTDLCIRDEAAPSARIADRSSGIIITTDNSVATGTLDVDDFAEISYFYAQIIKNVDFTKYGGITYSARLNNSYIPFSDISPRSSNTSQCVNGDSHIGIFRMVRSLFIGNYHPSNSSSINEVYSFPIISPIDVNYRLDFELMKDGPKSYMYQETEAQGVAMFSTSYPAGIGNMYRYNSVYSQQMDSSVGYPKPFDFTEDESSGVRVIASNKKINGEYIDSWTSFGSNESIEVDTKFGDIQSLISFKNNLFFFQNNGIGVLSVNQRSLIQDNNSISVALGTGAVLERYDYISEKYGILKSTDVLETFDSIYLIDRGNLCIVSIPSVSDISTLNGIRSELSKYVLPASNIAIGHDQIFKEVLFTIDSHTYCYNELIGKFMSKYSATPLKYIGIKNKLLSYIESEDNDDTSRYLFIHNKGDYGEVYSESKLSGLSTASVKCLVNPYGSSEAVFDVVGFKTQSFSDYLIVDKVRVTTGGSSSPTVAISNYADESITPTFQHVQNFGTYYVTEVSNNITKLVKYCTVNSTIGNSIKIEISTGGSIWYEVFEGTILTISDQFDLITLFESVYGAIPNSFSDHTFNTISFSNSYLTPIVKQIDTTKMVGNTSSLVRAFRTQVPLTANGNRFADSYIIEQFDFQNKDNIRLVLYDVTNHVRFCHK